jgi:hypothetical protein
MPDYPDGQAIPLWVGDPILTQSAYAIGAGTHTFGPVSVRSWEGLILVAAPVGGACDFTVRANRSQGAATINVDTAVTVSAGAVATDAFALYGDQISLIVTGHAAGETVSFDLLPTNTVAQVKTLNPSTSASVNLYHNGVLVAAEPGINIKNGYGMTVADADAAGTDVDYTFPVALSQVSNALTADVTMTNANQYYDGPSVSCVAGTWLLVGSVTVYNSSGASVPFTAKLWDGTTTFAAPEAGVPNASLGILALSAIVSPGVTTSYKISVASTTAGRAIKAAPNDNSPGNYASVLNGIRIA